MTTKQTKKKPAKPATIPPLDGAIEKALDHLSPELATPDAVRLVKGAVAVAYEAFILGSPSRGTVTAVMRDAIRVGLAFIPSTVDKGLRNGVEAALLGLVSWLWMEMQPRKLVVKSDAVLTVVVED
jgi:hypothetical protein